MGPRLVDHEVGHALEVLDDMAAPGLLVIDRYQDAREWWAEDWALCTTGYLAQFVRMLGGHEIAAEMTCLSAAHRTRARSADYESGMLAHTEADSTCLNAGPITVAGRDLTAYLPGRCDRLSIAPAD